MSILGQATQAQQGSAWGDVLMFVPPAVVSVVVAWLAGVFRRGSVVGPPRVDDREPLGLLLAILGGGFFLWIVVQVFCLAPGQVATSPAPAPSTAPAVTARPSAAPAIPPQRMAIASSVPAIAAGAFMVLANLVIRPSGLRRLGLAPAQFGRGVVQGLVGSLIVVPLIFLVAQATQIVWQSLHYQHPREHDLLRIMGESQSPFLSALLIASAVLIAPLFEELLFRGHLQTVITYGLSKLAGTRADSETLPRGFEVIVPGGMPEYVTEPQPRLAPPGARWASIFITSLAFSAVHPAWTIPPIFVLSVCLGYAYERTGNLWTAMTIHALFNTTSTVLYLTVMQH